MFGTLADSGLAKARMKIGRALHWDDRDLTLPMGLVGDRVSLAVYVKHRGLASRLYMAAIWPARHLFVYPAMISCSRPAPRQDEATHGA